MAIKSARYAGRLIASAGIGLSHSSNYATRDRFGQTVPINTPCYDQTMAFGSAPDVPATLATVSGIGGGRFVACIGSGRWINGQTAVAVVRSGTLSTAGQLMLRIGIGNSFTAGAFDSGSAPVPGTLTTGITQFDIGCQTGDLGDTNKAGANNSDLLRGAGAGNGETANARHSPSSITITDGLIIAHCAVWKWSGSWTQTATSLCQYDIATAKWKLIFQSTDSSSGKTRTSLWINTYWTAKDKSESRPTELWAAFVDYVSGSLTGDVQVCMLIRASRPNVNSVDWTVQAMDVYRRTNTLDDTHFHSAIVTPLGVIISQGHYGTGSGILLAWNKPWEWPTGPAGENDNDSVNGWVTNLRFSGKRSTGAANRFFNQYMSVAPAGRDHENFIVCSDLGVDPFSLMTLSGTTNKARFTAIPAGQGASFGLVASEMFGITCDDNHNPSLWVSLKVAQSSAFLPAVAPFGGVSMASYGQAKKILYSRDGRNWSQLYATTFNVARDPKAVGGQVFFSTVNATNTVLQAVTVPPISVGRPMIVAANVNNYALAQITNFSALGGTNTFTDVSLTYEAPNAISNGHTVPRCPSNRPVYYGVAQESGGSNWFGDNGVTYLTSGADVSIPASRVRISFWFYLPPASVPFVSDTTAPFDGGTQMTVRFVYASAAGDPIFSDIILDKIQGAGWTKIVVETTAGTIGGNYPRRFFLNLLSNQVSLNVVSFLFSIESIVAGNADLATPANRLVEFPIKPLPAPATFSAAPASVFSDTVETVGFSPGDNWTYVLALQLPDDGPDQYTYNTRPANRKLFHLVQSGGTNSLGVNQNARITCEYDVANARFSFTDGTTTTTLAAGALQAFELGRASQIGIGISRAAGGSMVFAAFIGGTTVATTTATWSTPVVRPTKVVHADESLGVVEPHLVHAVYCDDAVALNASQLTALLQSGTALAVPTGSSGSGTSVIAF